MVTLSLSCYTYCSHTLKVQKTCSLNLLEIVDRVEEVDSTFSLVRIVL